MSNLDAHVNDILMHLDLGRRKRLFLIGYLKDELDTVIPCRKFVVTSERLQIMILSNLTSDPGIATVIVPVVPAEDVR